MQEQAQHIKDEVSLERELTLILGRLDMGKKGTSFSSAVRASLPGSTSPHQIPVRAKHSVELAGFQ
jgi:hypothetical protein